MWTLSDVTLRVGRKIDARISFVCCGLREVYGVDRIAFRFHIELVSLLRSDESILTQTPGYFFLPFFWEPPFCWFFWTCGFCGAVFFFFPMRLLLLVMM